MRMSCNGCRVLRKGCSDNCAIRPCLQWIRSPDAQGNATVFLAKFYGRAGLVNLITAGPEHVRPAIFRSLLYEACGRMLNPVYGSVGLLWSGNWQLCQAAVESVLRGMPIAQPPPTATAVPPHRSCDIRHRHVARREADRGAGAVDAGLHRMANSSRGQFKRSGAHRSSDSGGIELVFSQPSASSMLVDIRQVQPLNWAPRQPSHEYSASHDDDGAVRESDSNASVDTVDVSHVSQSEPEPPREESDDRAADGLDLTLGLPPTVHKVEPSDVDDDHPCHRGEPMKLGLAMADSRAR